MSSERRVIAELALSFGGDEVFSYLPVDYNGMTKMLFDGNKGYAFAIFPNHDQARQAACVALIPHVGGYSNISLVEPDESEQVTHENADDWIFEY